MFNRGGFNQSEFNVSNSSEVYLYGAISAEGEFTATVNFAFTLRSTISADGGINGTITRDIRFVSDISADSELIAGMVRLISMSSDISGESTLEAATTKIHVELIEFMSNLQAGDVLIIDSKEKKVTLNGVNASHLAEGFMNILAGTNEITYTDTGASRSVLVRIVHRDKFLY